MTDVSGNAYFGRTLKRMEIVYKNTSIKFAVNPEDYTQREPNKANITQTKGGAWIDAWGAGIAELSIKGITGVTGGDKKSVDVGYQRWKTLRDLFTELYEDVTDGEEVTELIKFYNFTDNEYFYCYPTQSGIELHRSKSRPHMYQYTINLWCIRRMGTPSQKTGKIGNPFKPADKGTKTITQIIKSWLFSGGDEAYRTRASMTASEADAVTITSTKTRTVQGVQEDCRNYYLALEPIIGGKNGKIVPLTGYQCAQGIMLQSSGVVYNLDSFNLNTLVDGKLDKYQSMLLSEVNFIKKVSINTYSLWTKIKKYSEEVLSDAYSTVVGNNKQQKILQAISNGKTYGSTLYTLIDKYSKKSILSKAEASYLKLIMLESMMVYRELYIIYNQGDELSTTLTSDDLKTLINNIRAVIMNFNFEHIDSIKSCKQDISSELRQLEKILTQVATDVISYL